MSSVNVKSRAACYILDFLLVHIDICPYLVQTRNRYCLYICIQWSIQASTPHTGLHFRCSILIRLRGSKRRHLTLVIHVTAPPPWLSQCKSSFLSGITSSNGLYILLFQVQLSFFPTSPALNHSHTTAMASPKIILYTYHGCPWAHRAHIALKETGLDYEEVIIDIKKPREPWYLEINPV